MALATRNVQSTVTTASRRRSRRSGPLPVLLSGTQQVGNSLGVSATGIIFFGSVHSGYGPAFARSALQLAALLAAVFALSRLLPGRDTH